MTYLFHDLITNAANRVPGKKAIFHKDETLTYEQTCEKSIRLQHALIDAGIKKGNRVCFYLEKRFEKVITIFGISFSGAVIVPIRRLSRPHQAAYIIENCGAKALITTSLRIPSLLEHIERSSTLNTIIIIGEIEEDLPIPGKIRLIKWDNIMVDEPTTPINTYINDRDLAAILYTSGSTGQPKGVALTHLNLVEGAKKVSDYLKINSNDRLLSILTFSFDYGLNQLTTAFLQGAQIVLLDYLFPRDILHAVDRYGITALAAVSTTWLQLLQISWENTTMNNLRYITNSGGAIPPDYVAELRKRLPHTDIYLMYGLTEAFRSTYLDPTLVNQYSTSMGKAVPGEEIMVLDENNRPVKPGHVGELVHRGVLVSQGYWGDPELTATRFKRNPIQLDEVPIPEMVVYSGDYVKIDEDGFLYFIGRKDEMIKCAGNRISPTEVEEVLYNSGFISEAVAMGKPHDIYGQVVCVVLSLLPHEKKSENDIQLYCRNNMPPYMIPHEIKIWDKLPQNTNGKLDRAKIKEQVG